MKKTIWLAAIATAILLAPGSVRAQGYPYGGSSTTTIYVPSTETTTTTTTVYSAPVVTYPQSSLGSSITTIYPGSSDPIQRHHRYSQPPLIFPQQGIYPRPIQSKCSTVVIGSPIPSPVPLDRYTGRPCS